MDFFEYWNHRYWINRRDESTENKAVQQADGGPHPSPHWNCKQWKANQTCVYKRVHNGKS